MCAVELVEDDDQALVYCEINAIQWACRFFPDDNQALVGCEINASGHDDFFQRVPADIAQGARRRARRRSAAMATQRYNPVW